MKKLFTRRYVGDYRLENVEDAHGRLRTVPVYRGKAFRLIADEARICRAKRICAVCAAIAVLAELPPLLVNSRMMRTWFVSAPVILGLIPLILLVSCVIRFCRAKGTLRREDRDIFENRYPASALAFAALNTIAAIAGICAAGPEWALCLCPAVCAACGWTLFARRGALKCAEIPEEK